MIEALNRCQGRASSPGRMFERVAERDLLVSPAGQEILRRIDAATCLDVGGIDRDRHIEQIALVAIRAKGLA